MLMDRKENKRREEREKAGERRKGKKGERSIGKERKKGGEKENKEIKVVKKGEWNVAGLIKKDKEFLI